MRGRWFRTARLSALGEDEPRDCNRQDLEELHSQGLIRLTKVKRSIQTRRGAPRPYWEEWFFEVTDAGFEQIELEQRAATEAERGAHEGASGGYDWETEVLPVLKAVYAASGSADPRLGVSQKTINEALGRQPDDPRTDRILTMLIGGGYLETTVEAMGSRFCQITEKGLSSLLGGGHRSTGRRLHTSARLD
jgi:hypothetical protein